MMSNLIPFYIMEEIENFNCLDFDEEEENSEECNLEECEDDEEDDDE